VTYEEAQELARKRGVKKSVYETIRFLIIPLVKIVWRFRITGSDQIPKEGPVVIAETARMVLRDGGVLALFPEGTRHRDPDELRAPRRGAGRLAIEAGAPIVPAAISGTEKLFFAGFLPRPVRVQVAFAAPIPATDLEATPEAAADLIENQVWPEVEKEFRRLRANPGLVAAVLAALAGGGAVALRAQQRKPKTRVQKAKAKVRKKKR
jgi:1-acyl-sn-glycerol-3-phosphate acyltransferase